ncbi:S8 family serine peptidase [Pseudoalteromonas luteoviolacea]|uniref:S8 family serine peptidase n=1 Tax=Pseudoalteromonas luteoviolacea TaxID=43657 RepID=UPI001154D1F8|nr:S8 family serine peptidase [Pseudoalteromonas luteoviolacea]TQF68009.1 S8 family serine peptidase [Pseudoalteromonas luteoviolacea]
MYKTYLSKELRLCGKLSIVKLGLLGALLSNPTFAEEQVQRYIVKLNDEVLSQYIGLQGLQGEEAVEAKNQLMYNFASQVNSQIIRALPHQNAFSAMLSARQYHALLKSPSTDFIELDPKRYLASESIPYGIEIVQARQLSDAQAGNIKVCVMDTGYTPEHPDLPEQGVTGDDGHGDYDTGDWFHDGHGHGTHVAGTIAALGGNGLGVVGVNPSGRLGLHIVKVFDDKGQWTYGSEIAYAVEQCAEAGADIINMSLGGTSFSVVENEVFNRTYAEGVLHIAAAGNNGSSMEHYPASYDNVISVAAVDQHRNRASFSQFHGQVELAAPGVEVNSTLPGNRYAAWSGTSMATPHVTGVAALVWSNHRECSNTHIRDALVLSALDRGNLGRDQYYGYGIVQAKAASDYLTVHGCESNLNQQPVASFSHSSESQTVSFFDQSTDDSAVISHYWQFNDANNPKNDTSTEQNPTYTYVNDGRYYVTLLATDAQGKASISQQEVIVDSGLPDECEGLPMFSVHQSYGTGDRVFFQNYKYVARQDTFATYPTRYPDIWRKQGRCYAENVSPTADFSAQANGLSVTFINNSWDDNGIVSHVWDFGDGHTSSAASPIHTYTKKGEYAVTLTVQDQALLSSTKELKISIDKDAQTCGGLPAWQADKTYVKDDQVHLNNVKYTAKWSTRKNPEQNSGRWDVWVNNGVCH